MSGAWAGRNCRSSLLKEGPIPRLRRGLPHEWGRWRDGDDLASFAPEKLPSTLMNLPVMPGAQKDEILQLVAPAMRPVDDVMAVAPGGRSLAAWPAAVLVAGDERPPPGAFDRALRPADIDHHRVLHQNSGQAAVAGPALDRLRGDGERELALRTRRAGEVEQGLDRARDLHLDLSACGRP